MQVLLFHLKSLLKDILLILKALEYQVALFILKLTNLIVLLHVVILQTLTEIVPSQVFRVEHVRAKIQNCPLVNFFTLFFVCLFPGVFLYEILNALLEIALLFVIVLLFVHVVEADHDVHQDGCRDGLLYQAQ